MNGRIYDPTLGRFLQADPHIQAPKNSQNYNRYSYVLNNPLSYTDPSGYFFSGLKKKLSRAWKDIKPIAGAIVGAALVYFTGGMGSPFLASWYGAAGLGAITGSLGAAFNGGNILQGALWGAASGAMFYGVGQGFDPGTFGNIAGNAIGGGIMSDLQGGNFGHGFWAAGFAAAAKPAIYEQFGYSPDKAAQRVITGAVIGGTASVISGGKFANGAATAAFSQMLNGENYAKKKWAEIQRFAAATAARASKIWNASSVTLEQGPGVYVRAGTEGFNFEAGFKTTATGTMFGDGMEALSITSEANFMGTASGTKMGWQFYKSEVMKTLDTSNGYDLIETKLISSEGFKQIGQLGIGNVSFTPTDTFQIGFTTPIGGVNYSLDLNEAFN